MNVNNPPKRETLSSGSLNHASHASLFSVSWSKRDHFRHLGRWHIDMCHGQGCRVLLGMVVFPPSIGNPYNGYINPY